MRIEVIKNEYSCKVSLQDAYGDEFTSTIQHCQEIGVVVASFVHNRAYDPQFLDPRGSMWLGFLGQRTRPFDLEEDVNTQEPSLADYYDILLNRNEYIMK